MIKLNIYLDIFVKKFFLKNQNNLSNTINSIMKFLGYFKEMLLKFFLNIMIKKGKLSLISYQNFF